MPITLSGAFPTDTTGLRQIIVPLMLITGLLPVNIHGERTQKPMHILSGRSVRFSGCDLFLSVSVFEKALLFVDPRGTDVIAPGILPQHICNELCLDAKMLNGS